MKKTIASFVVRLFRLFSPQTGEKAQELLEEIYVSFIHRNGVKCSQRYRDQKGLKLNVGSGPYPKVGFVNLDFSPKADLRLDLRQRIPLSNESCELIFSEHFVEHLLYPEGVDAFFTNAYELLNDGGCIKLSVPETSWPIREYVSGGTDYLRACKEENWHPPEAQTFMEHLNYHFRQRCIGRRESHFECHRFAYDFETMKAALERNGFVDVKERAFDPSLDSPHRRKGSLFVEASKKS